MTGNSSETLNDFGMQSSHCSAKLGSTVPSLHVRISCGVGIPAAQQLVLIFTVSAEALGVCSVNELSST